MQLPGAQAPQIAAFLDQLFTPPRQFARAVFGDRAGALRGRLPARPCGPGSPLDPIGYAFDQPPIPGGLKYPRQTPLARGTLAVPGWIIRRGSLLVDFLQPFDCDIEVAHRAKMGVDPFQFIPYPRSLWA